MSTTSPLGPVELIERVDPRYPGVLLELAHPPDQLELVGALPDLSLAVAIVGTRSSDASANDFARKLARELAEAGVVIVSGGAFGIDAEAHRGALEAGGITVAVLPTGLARPYPIHHRSLFGRIVERGCVLSEVSGSEPGYDSAFLNRNRLVCCLTQITVVVQAPVISGALSTAAHAKRLGRAVMAVPYAPWDQRGQGCLTLLAEGARICRTSADVLTLAAPRAAQVLPQRPRRPKKSKEFQELDADEQAVVAALDVGPLDVDGLCERSGLPAPQVQRAVLMLLLSKVIREVGSGGYARADYP